MQSKYLLSIFIIALMALVLVYANHFDNSFHFDDFHTIEQNAYIRRMDNVGLFFKDGNTFSVLPTNRSYRPVVSTALAVAYWLGGGYEVFWFHVLIFGFFVAQNILLFFVFRRILTTCIDTVSWADACSLGCVLVYSFHPAIAETVNYIISISDVLSTFFVVLTFFLYQYSPFSKRYYLYLLPVALGVLAKPTAVMLAPLLLVYVYLFEKKAELQRLIFPFVWCLALYFFVDFMTPSTWVGGGDNPLMYFLTQFWVMVYYVSTFFLPIHLSADTDWQLLGSVFDVRFFAGLLLVGVLLAVIFKTYNKPKLKPIAFGLTWFLLALLPTSSVVPLAEVLNDHRLFFPYIGMSLAVIYGLTCVLVDNNWLKNYRKAFILIGVLLFLGLCFGTYQRNEVWDNEESLWYNVTIRSPKNGRGLMNYGLTQMAKGNHLVAYEYYTKALILLPKYSYLHVNMGILLQAMGKSELEVEPYFKNGIEYGAIFPLNYYYYGKFLCDRNRLGAAIPLFQKALSMNKIDLYSHQYLAFCYLKTNQNQASIAACEQGLKFFASDQKLLEYKQSATQNLGSDEPSMVQTEADLINESLVYYQLKSFEKCIESCQKALILNPNSAEALNNIGSAYNELKRYDKAIEALEKALKINPNFELAKNNLAWAKNQLK